MDIQSPTNQRGERPDGQDWRAELDKAGLFRRIMQGRRWYGGDWWLIFISSLMVTIFVVLALFPGLIAPHGPREQVGPRFLAPFEQPDREVLIAPEDSMIRSLLDLVAQERIPTGVVQGTPSSEAARDNAQSISDELQAQGSDDRVRLAIRRYETLEESLSALTAGDLTVVVASERSADSIIDDYPELIIAGTVGAGLEVGGFVLGTNQIGQDVLSRLIWGTRVTLLVGLSASILSLLIGVPLGLLAGFAGGRFDRFMTILMDSLYAFPGLILAIALTAVLGPSILNVIGAVAVLYIPTYYRIVRGQTLAAKEKLYVEAARSLGARGVEILRRYIYPNVIPSVAIIFSVNVADAILTGAALSFLGLGLPPTTPDWGIDLARGQESIQTAWWLITFPGIAVMLVVLSFTMMGEGLTEIFNPKLRDR